MANQDVRVSALQSASTLSTEDLALATVVDELSETGYTSKKITEGAKASQYLEAFTFANLNTTAKTIVGAINEAATTGGSDEFIIHMTDTTVTETAADIIDAFDNGSEIWLESQITGEAVKARLPLLAYISDSSQLVLRFSGITYASNRYRYCDIQILRSPEQIVGRQAINVTFAVIDDATTSASSVWSSQKTAGELAGKAEIDDTAVSSSTAWSSERIVSLLPTESASGAVANFTDGADDVPVKSLLVDIDYKDTTGYTEANVTRTGKNLLDEHNSIYVNRYFKNMGSYYVWGEYLDSASIAIPCKPNTTYTISCSNNNATFLRVGYIYIGADIADTNTVIYGVIVKNTNSPITITTDNNAVTLVVQTNSNITISETAKLQIEKGFDATTYEAYQGTTYPVTWETEAGTVYGGYYESKTGVLTSTKAQDGTDLPDPVVTQITPTELSTLYGVNNIWADTGDVTVDYRADVQKYIDNRLSSGTRSLSLVKSPVETEETKQEGDENVDR